MTVETVSVERVSDGEIRDGRGGLDAQITVLAVAGHVDRAAAGGVGDCLRNGLLGGQQLGRHAAQFFLMAHDTCRPLIRRLMLPVDCALMKSPTFST